MSNLLSNDNLMNVIDTNTDGALSTTTYPILAISIRRSSVSETIMESASMSALTFLMDLQWNVMSIYNSKIDNNTIITFLVKICLYVKVFINF